MCKNKNERLIAEINMRLDNIKKLVEEMRVTYSKVRDIKTGREFLAGYSKAAEEWYEKDTGKAYSVGSVEVVNWHCEPPRVKLMEVTDETEWADVDRFIHNNVGGGSTIIVI